MVPVRWKRRFGLGRGALSGLALFGVALFGGCGDSFSAGDEAARAGSAGTGSGGTASSAGGPSAGSSGSAQHAGSGGTAVVPAGGSASDGGELGEGGEGGDGGGCRVLRSLPATDAIAVDYGPPEKDGPYSDPLVIASGSDHEHAHDMVAWLEFDLGDVPSHAELRALSVTVFATDVSANQPPLVLYHSEFNGWIDDPETPETPELVERGERLGGEADFLLGYIEAAAEVDAYAPYWEADLEDDVLTLGVAIDLPHDGEASWAYLVGANQPSGSPELELVTCE